MSTLNRVQPELTAAEFLETDQHQFGDAWRYELVDGAIVAHAAPSPRHAAIHANMAVALGNRLRGHPCRLEIGSGAAPIEQQRPTARIPDLTIRCDGLPRVVVEVISPSELRDWRSRDRRRRDEQGVDGVLEIIEIYQDEPAVHLYRKSGVEWLFDAVGDVDGTLRIASLGLAVPLAEIYEGIDLDTQET